MSHCIGYIWKQVMERAFQMALGQWLNEQYRMSSPSTLISLTTLSSTSSTVTYRNNFLLSSYMNTERMML